MIDQEQLQDLTEGYLKSLISSASESLAPDFPSSAPFGELGIDSFRVLKIIRTLETDFGTLPKTLLFENFTIHDLAAYFIRKHEPVLTAKFAKPLKANLSSTHSNGRRREGVESSEQSGRDGNAPAGERMPICILETEAVRHPELGEMVTAIFKRHKVEGSVSRGTRKIAPNLFIGQARCGYFHYGRRKDIVLVYGYTGPRDYCPALLEELREYCTANSLQLNILADEEITSVGGTSFSATPFGVLQRISNLRAFRLEGGAMRRLRYQVTKFQNSGVCRTQEYRCGSNKEIDKNIASIIDRWCGTRTMVNPLVHDVKGEILAGTLAPEHRLFLTYLDDVLQSVILITAMSAEQNGYLMDLEFYPPEMPMGGLEYAIVQIIELLKAEGCDVLSLGGTHGCKLQSSAHADPEVDKILDELREQNIFNDAGNLQFKNKFRPANKTIFLCRPVGSSKPDNVIDIIMMIADPDRMQTSTPPTDGLAKEAKSEVTASAEAREERKSSASSQRVGSHPPAMDRNSRSRILADFGFNPLKIPHELVAFDLKTDSWAQLQMPSIEAHMRQLHAQIQWPVHIDDSLRTIFPFAHFVLTTSGQEAENIFFKSWPKKGIVLQNLLFPSTLFHQIDKGFTPRELPHPEVFHLNSQEKYKGNMDWEALQAQVQQDSSAIACVCVEVGNNAAGGYPVSIAHLRDVKALLARHSIPLVIDATRVMENAQFVIEQEKEYAGKSIWTVVREILSCADAVIGSLTKDFCVNKGGIIATNDLTLLHKLQEVIHEEGVGIDLIDKKMIALALRNRNQIESKVLRRVEGVRRIWRALNERNVPIVCPAGGHCILIDVKQIPEFNDFKDPVASFVAWMYLNTGIRAAAHSVGMQKRTSINGLVRLAIPVGLNRDQIDGVIDGVVQAFDRKTNIPEIVMESSVPQPLGAIHANYKLVKYHSVSESIPRNAAAIVSSEKHMSAAQSSKSGSSLPPSLKPAPARSPGDTVPVDNAGQETKSNQSSGHAKVRRTQDVAIIGMAGRYPKAKNLRELWANLAQGRDCIEEIPADRYAGRLRHGRSAKYHGGFIEDVDKFDSLFFNISPREAEMLDPQERLFLEVAWEAIEDAGYYPEILAKGNESRNIGVFVGAVWAMYQMLGVEEKHAGNKIVPNSFLWGIANRVSYCFNLSGPSLTVDTACSSSLTAIYLACEAIRAGECSAAIVGGVNLDLHQAKLDINQAGGALSRDGVCRSFGKGANGYVAGEGVGALLLKPLEQAERDGDNIYGVIKGAVLNHGGRTSGYTVPNPKAQTNLVSLALKRAKIDARSIGYIEAHGTGTELGDPIEINSLNNAFSADCVANQSCAIGSIKTNIGHLEAAAGIVSVSKVLLQMKHRQLVPSLHSAELNEFIDFKNSPFYVVQHLEDWNAKEVDGVLLPLRAGISSFGAGGSNAHVILEDYEPAEKAKEPPVQQSKLIFPLSARNEDQLRETAARLAEFLQQNAVDVADAAYTLQAGRRSLDHRLAIVANTKEELSEKLSCFLAGKKADGILSGHVKGAEGFTRLLNREEKEEFIRLLSQHRDPYRLAELWVEGLLTDWQGIQAHNSGRRVSLPTYPFADKRHWCCQKSAVHDALRPAAAMHPLVDTNESTFERQLFKKTFHNGDFFIYDHHVADIPTLPGVAYLELARKAGEIAAGRKVQKIRNIVWVSPITVQNSKPKEAFVELKPSEATVRFEVFSNDEKGNKVLHCQGTLLYATKQEAAAEPEYIDLANLRARCAKVIDGEKAYPKFKLFGLNLGPSFQVLQDVYKNENEVLGVLQLPEFRQGDLQSMILPPSLVDGSLQAGMAAQLGDKADEMFVPFSIGEVEILNPLQSNCFSYVTEAKDDNKKEKRESARVVKSNVLIVDEAGKVLVKIREPTGVPLREVAGKSSQGGDTDGFTRLYYSYEWEKTSPVVENAEQGCPGSIVLFDTNETLRDLCQQRLKRARKNCDQVILIQPGESFQDLGNQSFKVNPQNKDDFTQLFALLVEKRCSLENICFAWPVSHADLRDEKAVKVSLERGVFPFLFVCQALIKQKLDSNAQLLYLFSAQPGDVQPYNEAARAFVNTLHLEHPKLLCKAVEVRQENAACEPILDAVAAEFQAQAQDSTAVRYEEQQRYVKKLQAFHLEKAGAASPSHSAVLREKGVYLITGGAGGLGLIFAEFLAKEYKARLLLTGRSELSVEQKAKLEEIRNLGGKVLYLPADVSHYQDVKNLVNEGKSRFGEIHGVIHSAGVLRDSLVRNKTPEEMNAVFAPKIYGTLHLDEATKNEALDFFVTFSSLAAVAGNAGQCDYSFGNHFMDSFVAERELLRAKGERSGKALSLNWSLWADGGMKVDAQTELYFKKTVGIKPLSINTGLEALVNGLASERSQFAVLEGAQEKLELAWGLRKKSLAPGAPVPPSVTDQSPIAPGSDEEAGGLLASLRNDISRMVMDFLKLDAGDMSTDKILLDLGFDSIGLTTFANALNEKYQLDITPVLFFDYPSVGEIAKYLSVERSTEISRFYKGTANTATGAPPAPTQQHAKTRDDEISQEAIFKKGWDPTALDRDASLPASSGGLSRELRFADMPIAIVGMSGVMPQSEDLEEFWENLKNSKDMISVIPPDRWRWEDYYGDPLKEANKSNSKWGGFMNEIDKFDPLFFGISPREAQTMDPQQRIFLETVWRAIEDSGQKVSDLSGTKTGLFVGVATNDYLDVMNSRHIALDGYSASGNSHSVLANRVSFLLNLHGPSAPIDTACSSSLIALHRAIESIHTGSCDMAIVGGVQVMLSPAAYISFGMAGMLSGDGKCKTFDKRANGYVRGEGCGAIFLKPLSVAEADGNHIYAVIRATAENHGGRVTTLTAPNASAQSALLIEAYEKAQVDPTTVGYIECHGTGTSLGDPIEIQALSKAFSELYKRQNKTPAKVPHCGLSSVKTNIGHLETAAGIASVLKVLLAMKHKQIPANVHFEEINPYINLKGTPFYIADKLTSWEAIKDENGSPLPRRAGVSSFGFGGANAHIVLEEYIPSKSQPASRDGEPQLIVLSAKNEDRLKAYMQSMRAYLDQGGVDLSDFAYTLQVGRDELPERLALVITSIEDVKGKLTELLQGREIPKDSYRNNVRNTETKSQTADGTAAQSLVRTAIEQKDLSKLAQLWVFGTKIDWRLLYESGVPKRISVPTYPFARERYWIPEGKTIQVRRDEDQIQATVLHPLIHRNVSTLQEQKFASTFFGDEFYLADHVVETQRILPGVAYLEMARAAGELSGQANVGVIRDLTWERPLIVGDGHEEVEVSLTPVKNEIRFSVRTVGKEKPIVHCNGKLAYSIETFEPDVLDIAAIQDRCPKQVVAGNDLYSLLSGSGLKLGKSFQIVQGIYANESESLAIVQLPEHLKADANQFWLHPALMDGSLHSGIGLLKANGMDLPLSIPYSVAEVQIFHPLRDLYYSYATWGVDNPRDKQDRLKVTYHLLDKTGRVLVRIKELVSKPVHGGVARKEADRLKDATGQEEIKARLQSLVPVWNSVSIEASKQIVLPESTRILLVGGNQSHLEWVQKSYPKSQRMEFASPPGVEMIAERFGDCSFDQLLWVAPDVSLDAGLRNSEEERIVDQQAEGVLAVYRIIKALLRLGYANKKLQWTVVTGKTQPVIEKDPIQPTHSGIAGLIGSLAKEYPQWNLRLLDLDSLASVSARECLSMPCDEQGNMLAHRQGQWFQQGLSLMTAVALDAPIYRQNGVYVVIGGAGGLGEVWSRFMIEHYQANVVWIGRRNLDAAIEGKINSLARLGPAPLYISADATNLDSLAQACKKILKTYPTIHGVVHSAIVLQDQTIARMEEPAFRASLSAKVDTSVNMNRVFGKHALDFMLFFSSVISFFKTPGQSNYSAGCTFTDGFAHRLQQQHAYPVKTMNWGYWGNVGVVADEFHRKIMEQMGIGSIEPEEGMASLQALLSSQVAQMAFLKTLHSSALVGANLSEAIANYQQRSERNSAQPAVYPKSHDPRVKEVPVTKAMLPTRGSSSRAEMTEQIGCDHIQQIIIQKLSEALKMNAARIRSDAPFADYGVDSIIGLDLVRSINETLKVELEPVRLFEYSTASQLAEYIWTNWQEVVMRQLTPIRGVPQESSQRTEERVSQTVAPAHRFIGQEASGGERSAFDVGQEGSSRDVPADSIAIIGMSGRFAESESLEEFWRNLRDGRDLVKQVSRWSTSDCVISGTSQHGYCSHGSFIDSVDRFDASFFRISSLEAVYMDPQQRLFLEESWRALEDAGYAGKSVNEKQCGVYVGCGTSNYDRLFVGEPPAQAWWGNSQSVAPARIAYHLNLQGPAIAVDTACSSSLVAIHLACQGLWSRETEMALAGGVYLQATSAFHQVANRAGMLSPEGKCFSFDARANGFVPGEGVGVVVLKRLKDALRDRDHIYGVITGSGINQNGRSNGLIAPNGRAQERLERSVYESFKIDPQTIQVVEAHGTGTVVGDSIEYGALIRVFREHTDKKQFCAIGSVKTNIGHAATAAGVASVLKVLLSLKYRQIPPSLHFEKANPAIDFDSGPFYLNTRLQEWKVQDNRARRAAISSFGFSGTNAHLVIDEAPSVEPVVIDTPGYVVVLSAQTSEQLQQRVRNLLGRLKDTFGMSMNDLSFTLFVGRMHLTHRLACLARNQEELIQLLEQWSETGRASQIYASEIQEGNTRKQPAMERFGNHCIQECRNAVAAELYLENLAAIAELYVQGYSLDFDALFSKESSRRIPLPTYPFAKDHCWIANGGTAASATRPSAATILHPLLHINTSTLQQQSYSSIFTGEESFLKGQLVMNGNGNQKVLPCPVYLEMARAAVEEAASVAPGSSVTELHNVLWGPPATAAGNNPITIALLADDNEEIAFEVCGGDPGQETIHCQGRAGLGDLSVPETLDIAEVQSQMQRGKLDSDSVYASLEKAGVHCEPAHQAIKAIHEGDQELIAQLCLPGTVAKDEVDGDESRYWLHPIMITSALQAGIWLIGAASHESRASLLPHSLDRLRVLSPCEEEMVAWVRHSLDVPPGDQLVTLDIDLINMKGNICVEMRGLAFQRTAATKPAAQATWLFSKCTNGHAATHNGFHSAAEKIGLFLRQEIALQMQKPIDKIPLDQSYFDLGLTSLGIATLIQKVTQLLDVSLLPSVLFEYRDIQSLAAYFAETYRSKVDTLTVTKQNGSYAHTGEHLQTHAAKLVPLARRRFFSGRLAPSSCEQTDVSMPEAEMPNGQILAKVLWQQTSLDDSYEKVSF